MSGGRRKTISDEEFLRVISTIQNEESDPVITSSELADEVPLGRQGVYQRLEELESQDLVRSKKVGTGRAWWLTVQGQASLNENSDAEGEDPSDSER